MFFMMSLILCFFILFPGLSLLQLVKNPPQAPSRLFDETKFEYFPGRKNLLRL